MEAIKIIILITLIVGFFFVGLNILPDLITKNTVLFTLTLISMVGVIGLAVFKLFD